MTPKTSKMLRQLLWRCSNLIILTKGILLFLYLHALPRNHAIELLNDKLAYSAQKF
jgi:hypothetical protein